MSRRSRRAFAAAVVLAAVVGFALTLDIGTSRRVVLAVSAGSFVLVPAYVARRPRPSTWRTWGIEKAVGAAVNVSTGLGMGYGFMGTTSWAVAGAAFGLALVVGRAALDVREARALPPSTAE